MRAPRSDLKPVGTPIERRLLPLVLAACTAVSILSTDLITPSIPELPVLLDGSVMAAQLTVGINLAAYAMAQLVHGPLADTLGRRRLLLWGMGLFAVVSAACLMVTTMEGLLIGRFVQGLFSSVPSVVVVLIIRELYPPDRAVRVMTIYGAALGIAPALGPLIGGYLHVWIGWQAGFGFLALSAALVAVLVWREVPESLVRPRRFQPARILATYRDLLANAGFRRVAMGISLTFGAFFAYIATAPLILIDLIGVNTQDFGFYNLLIIAAFVLGNAATSRMTRIWSPGKILFVGGRIVLVAVSMLAVGALVGPPVLALILGPMALFGVGLAFLLAAGPIVALDQAGEADQGGASALLGSMQLSASAFGGLMAALVYNETTLPMAMVMLAMVVAGSQLLPHAPRGGTSR